MLRSIRTSLATLRVAALGLAVPLGAQQQGGPCEQVTAACKSAGFVQGAGSGGNGLQRDCVFPIMQGIAQPAAATRPLPHVDPEVVAACRTRHPDFGQGKGPPPAALGAQVPAGASPLATQPPPPAQVPTGAATVTHLPDAPSPALTTSAPGKGSFAVEMEQIRGSKTPLGNASTTSNYGPTHTFDVHFAKGNQQAKAVEHCGTEHCLIYSVIISQMAHSSGGQPTPVVVYTLTHASIQSIGYAPCPGAAGNPCLAVVFGYADMNVQYPTH
jgi:hypothetical protein